MSDDSITHANIALFLLPALSLGAFIYGMFILTRAKRSATWPSTKAMMERSALKALRKTQIIPRYVADVSYTFTVDGKRYRGDVVAFGMNYFFANRTIAQVLIERYPAGKSVDVYYDPKQPDICTLEPGVTWRSYLPLLVSAGLLLATGPIYLMYSYFGY